MANNLENSINQANGKFVNFDQHREKYTTHYNALRDKVYSEWKGSGVLGKLVTGYTLGGKFPVSILHSPLSTCNANS